MAKVTGPNQFSLAVGHRTTAKVNDCDDITEILLKVALNTKILIRNVVSIDRLANWLVNHMRCLFGLSIEVRGRENLKFDDAYIIVCNHQSSLDLFGTYVCTVSLL